VQQHLQSIFQRKLPVMKKALITAACSIAIVSMAAVYSAVTSPRRSLDRFLAQVATVEVGKTRLDEWRRRVERDKYSIFTTGCDQQTCGIGWRGENGLLQRLHLAPRTVVDASVGFEDGIATGTYIILTIGKRDEHGEWRDDKGVVVQQSRTKIPSECLQDYRVDVLKRYGIGDRFWATVGMESCVAPAARARAIAINTSCLTKIGSCKTVEEMLPRVFSYR